jgi:hypothetical protein
MDLLENHCSIYNLFFGRQHDGYLSTEKQGRLIAQALKDITKTRFGVECSVKETSLNDLKASSVILKRKYKKGAVVNRLYVAHKGMPVLDTSSIIEEMAPSVIINRPEVVPKAYLRGGKEAPNWLARKIWRDKTKVCRNAAQQVRNVLNQSINQCSEVLDSPSKINRPRSRMAFLTKQYDSWG